MIIKEQRLIDKAFETMGVLEHEKDKYTREVKKMFGDKSSNERCKLMARIADAWLDCSGEFGIPMERLLLLANAVDSLHCSFLFPQHTSCGQPLEGHVITWRISSWKCWS